MCHDARRNSPSVALRRAGARSSATASRIASSSIARSSSSEIRCSAWSVRACRRCAGRRRLPTWSEGTGGVVRWAMATSMVACEMAARTGSEVKTVGAAWHEFRRKRAPLMMAVFIAVVVAGRVAIGGLSWRDLVAAAFLTVVYPFGEWAIHVHLLHLKPFRFRGRRVELPTAAAHREHHEQPERLDLINFSPREALAILLLAVPAAVAPLAFLLPVGALATALLTGYVLVGLYEWTHFLIHTAHRPRSRYYRSIWRTHRLHHFKNEHYWHGITSTVADRVIGTFPDQREVPKSRTARTLRDGA